MTRTKRPDAKRVYAPSMTQPGQSLIPAELLKRQLAGTLPDIEFYPQFTHDENGEQQSEDLSRLELHELYDLYLSLQTSAREREQELKKLRSEEHERAIIDKYKKSLLDLPPKEGNPLQTPTL